MYFSLTVCNFEECIWWKGYESWFISSTFTWTYFAWFIPLRIFNIFCWTCPDLDRDHSQNVYLQVSCASTERIHCVIQNMLEGIRTLN